MHTAFNSQEKRKSAVLQFQFGQMYSATVASTSANVSKVANVANEPLKLVVTVSMHYL